MAKAPLGDYAVKTDKLKDGREYQYLMFCDNKGAVEIDFGRMKE